MADFEAIKTDICVIGAGVGGLSVASSAALLGVPVILIKTGATDGDERDHGGVPTQTLIAAADAVAAGKRAAELGILFRPPVIDGAAVLARLTAMRRAIAPNDSADRYRALGVRIIEEEARFIDAMTVEAGRYRVTARRFIVATGAKPVIPDLPGLAEAPFLTSETVFDLADIPKRLAILGGGAIGVELAQAFCRLGTAVTLIEQGEILAGEDGEAVAAVRRSLLADGVDILEKSEIRRIQPLTSGLTLDLETPRGPAMLNTGQLLLAVGRRPDLTGLGLEAAGVTAGPQGIIVNDRLVTSNRRILAIGGCIGTHAPHIAAAQAQLALRNALVPFKARMRPQTLPAVVSCDPEIARIGPPEAEARQAQSGISTLRWPFSENERARIEARPAGFVKVLIDRKGRILGATIVGAGAGEALAPWCLAVSQGLTIDAMGDLTLPAPSRSEASRRAAMQALTPKLRSPWLARALRWSRMLG